VILLHKPQEDPKTPKFAETEEKTLQGGRGTARDNAEFESKHKRDENGKFTSGGGTGNRKGTKKKIHQRKPKRVKLADGEIWVPEDEYARVMSAVNTNLTSEERHDRIVSEFVGDYEYVLRKAVDRYVIIRKIKIE